jgi:hypothetical protein
MGKPQIFWQYLRNSEACGNPLTLELDDKTARKYQRKLAGTSIKEIDAFTWEYILLMLNDSESYTPEERNMEVEALDNYYMGETGMHLRPVMLSACADFIIFQDRTTTAPDVVSREEYPVLNYKQLALRRQRETSTDTKALEWFLAGRLGTEKKSKKMKEEQKNSDS